MLLEAVIASGCTSYVLDMSQSVSPFFTWCSTTGFRADCDSFRASSGLTDAGSVTVATTLDSAAGAEEVLASDAVGTLGTVGSDAIGSTAMASSPCRGSTKPVALIEIAKPIMAAEVRALRLFASVGIVAPTGCFPKYPK